MGVPTGSRPSSRGPTLGRLATLGVVIHLPDLLYLAALGYIAHQDVSTAHGLLLIVLFNIVSGVAGLVD